MVGAHSCELLVPTVVAELEAFGVLVFQDQTAIQKELMEDALHPTAQGYEV